jgi:hypothetical protein
MVSCRTSITQHETSLSALFHHEPSPSGSHYTRDPLLDGTRDVLGPTPDKRGIFDSVGDYSPHFTRVGSSSSEISA